MACHTPRDVARTNILTPLKYYEWTIRALNCATLASAISMAEVFAQRRPDRARADVGRRQLPFTSTPCFRPGAAPLMLQKSTETAKAVASVRSAPCRTLASPSLGKQYRFATAA